MPAPEHCRSISGTLKQTWADRKEGKRSQTRHVGRNLPHLHEPDAFRFATMDQIANAIAAARGAPLIVLRLGRASIAERAEPKAVRYDGSTHIDLSPAGADDRAALAEARQ